MPRKVKPRPANRLAYLRDALTKLEAMVTRALDGDRPAWTAAVTAQERAIAVQAEICELEAVQRRRTRPRTVAAQRAELLAEARNMRIAATAAGSFVAAKSLIALETDLLAQAQAAEDQATADRLRKRTDADILAEINRLRAARGADPLGVEPQPEPAAET